MEAIRWIVAPIKWLTRSRWRVQLAFLIVFNPFGLFYAGGLCLPVLNCHGCPAGKGPLEDARDAECVYCLDCFKCSALEMNFSSDKKKKE